MGSMDELINPAVVAALRSSLRAASPSLDLSALSEVEPTITGKLRERVDSVRDALLRDVPGGFTYAQGLVLDAMDAPQFAGWMIWPTSEFIVTRALESATIDDFDAAMTLLSLLTVRLTGEFAIRALLNVRPERALQTMQTWTGHDNEHVRRLATEGSRAYLPWAKRVPWLLSHPDATRPLLDATFRDDAAYVRRSVANHLNDLSRVDPTIAHRIATDWADSPDAHTGWVLRHGLRTLIKSGDQAALALVGYSGTNLRVEAPRLSSPTVPWNGRLTFDATVTNEGGEHATVAVDYSIGFHRANGSTTPKTFKLGSRGIAPGQSVSVTKSHSFRTMSTRRHYAGSHFLTVQANGIPSRTVPFILAAETAPAVPEPDEKKERS